MEQKQTKQFWDKWEEYEKLKMSLLKEVYLNMKIQSSFLAEMLSYVRKEKFGESMRRFSELYKHQKGLFQAWMNAEHGSINLKDIWPEEPPTPDDLEGK